MKTVSSLFPSSDVTEEPFKLDFYNSLHSVCVLIRYNKVLNDSKGQLKTKKPQATTAIPPQYRAYSKDGDVQGAAKASLSTDRDTDFDAYYFSALREHQRSTSGT
ncbi:uncharacterized protein N7473_010406 [Penicillium subrubescens]|jgi:hypothetical protein|uniref:uncharacterized protein n=1 Tax=Penicillium subrubescens TaxID=1316194 RepID=UPI0025450036|nr:uncharacterized protein N7473_010406 [Penicillium subrubescens]KAJ5883520.1 hypothetical protein N7473_010406 [Penicillium subrubescens]